MPRAFPSDSGHVPVQSLEISRDGHILAAASFLPARAALWGLPDGRPIGVGNVGDRYPLRLAVSPDGRRVATGGQGQGPNANIWDATLRSREMSLRGHLDAVSALAFSPNGRTLATGGVDGLLKLWHLPTQRDVLTLLRLGLDDEFTHLTFAPDGNWLGAEDKKGVLYLFQAPPLEGGVEAVR